MGIEFRVPQYQWEGSTAVERSTQRQVTVIKLDLDPEPLYREIILH